MPETDWFPFESGDGFIRLAGDLNGRPVSLVLDNGAFATTLDTAFATAAGIGPTGEVSVSRDFTGPAQFVRAAPFALKIAGKPIAISSGRLIDLSPSNQALAQGGAVPVQGVLGHDLFESAVVDIDFKGRRVALRRAAAFTPPPAATALPYKSIGADDMTRLSINDREAIPAIVDLGCQSAPLILSEAFAKREHLLDGPIVGAGVAAEASGTYSVRVVTIDKIAFGDLVATKVPAAIVEHFAYTEADAIIGIPLLRTFDRLIFDVANGRLFMAPSEEH